MVALSILQSTPAPHRAARINSNNTSLLGLESCSSMAELRQRHAHIIKLGLSSDNDAMGRVIKFCASTSGYIDYATKLFDGMPQPDVFIFNTVMKCLAQRHLVNHCIALYLVMLESLVCPNSFTFPILIKACAVSNAVAQGRYVHCMAVKFGLHSDLYSLNCLIQMYASFRLLDEARRAFDQMSQPNAVSWTTMISGCSKWGRVDEAYEIFQLMADKKSNPAACNAMLTGYFQSSRFQEAFALFDRLLAEDVTLDKLTATSMLSACTGLGALERGEWIHRRVEKGAIEVDSKLAASLVDMYCKCGSLEKAFKAFSSFPQKVVSLSAWNSMIGGLAIHGRGEAAVELFTEMEKKKIAPDHITFVNLLNACAHSGLVEEGQFYFGHMSRVYGIEPRAAHYGCVVDLLGRAGLLSKAKELLDEMVQSVGPDAGAFGALLGACRVHGDVALGEETGLKLIELDPENSGRYVLLGNLYANAGRWEDVANIRNLMSIRGVKKPPGSSMIELGGSVDEFTAGGNSHPESSEIYSKVHEMLERIRRIGYTADTDDVLHELSDEEKESPLQFHSEKLAIAYGLIRSGPGESLRVTKNLRVCRDCHEATKLVSLAYSREIIVRDRSRFHHFRHGKCSCNDYW
uniref:DYW domain-containing protein n=1 Tax=Kalanchoe fedtschenkoi TaxID=63787 RepID=A0A7N0UW11_KALFE